MGVDQQVGAAKGLSLPFTRFYRGGTLSGLSENRPQYPGPGRGTFINGSFFLERGAAGGFDAAAYTNPSDQT